MKKNIRRGIMAVDIRNTIGLGARLEWVLEILAFCDEHGLRPCFRFTYPGSETDYFSPFLAIKKEMDAECRGQSFARVYTIADLGFARNYDEELSIDTAVRLIDKYLAVKDNILQEVESFCRENFKGRKILGLHYRGTDKHTEAAEVSYTGVMKNISFFLSNKPEIEAMFVSTDSAEFLRYIVENPPGIEVLYRQDSFRSGNGAGVHFQAADKYNMNRDALVNCLLLSRCSGLIKSTSILSAWSVLFNPEIPLVMLNKPYNRYFPERELLQNVVHEPV